MINLLKEYKLPIFLILGIICFEPIYHFMHEKINDLGITNGTKVALYMEENALSETFKTKNALDVSTAFPANAYGGAIVKVYPVYLRYKKGGIYYLNYPTANNEKKMEKTFLIGSKIRMFDYYYNDEIIYILGVAN